MYSKNDKTALFDRHVAKIESEIVQLEEKRRQLNLDYKLYQLYQSEKAASSSPDEDDLPKANDVEGKDTHMDENHHQQPNLRKSTRNKPTSIDSSGKTSASSSGIWSTDLSAGLESIKSKALGQLYNRQLDPDAAPYIVYSLSDFEILEDWSILNMHKSVNARLNKPGYS